MLNPIASPPLAKFPCKISGSSWKVLDDLAFFAKRDAIYGYFQLAFEDKPSMLTTFMIPLGRCRYLRAPMDLSSALDK